MRNYDITTGMDVLSGVYKNAKVTQVPGKKLAKVTENGYSLVYRIRERTDSLTNGSVDVTLRVEPDDNEMADAQAGHLDGMVVIDNKGGYVVVRFAPLRTKGFFGTRCRRYGKVVRNTREGGYKMCYDLGTIMRNGGLITAKLV